MASLTTLLNNGIEGIPGFKSVSSALGYAEGTPIMAQCWQQLQTHPITAATGAIVGGWIGYSTFGIVGGLAAIITPNLVTSPNVMSAANTVFHHATSLYSSYYIQDMGPALNSLAKEFVWSVPSNQEIVVGHLDRLLGDMDAGQKNAFLTHLNALPENQKKDAHTLLSALVLLNVPPSERIAFCQLLENVPSAERSLFAISATSLGIPNSEQLASYDILRGVPANERAEFVDQANGFLKKLSSHTPPAAQAEVVRILSEIPKNERNTFIQASSDLSIQNDLGRVQLMQGLEKIKGKDRIAIAKTFNLVQQTLTKKEHEIDIDHKLEILTIATNLSEKEFKALWEEAKKPFDLSSAHPWTLNAKITILERLSSTPASIRNDVIRIASSQWKASDTTRILDAMSKLTPAQALHLKNDKYDLVALFADLTADEQKEFLEKMDKFPDANDRKEIINILLGNRGLLAKVESLLSKTSSKTKSSSPQSERKTSSLIRDLNEFEQKRTPLAPAPVVTPAPGSPSLTRRRLAERRSVAPAPVSNGNQINGIQGHPVSSASSSSSSVHVPAPNLAVGRPVIPPPPVELQEGPIKNVDGTASSKLPPPLTLAKAPVLSAPPLKTKSEKVDHGPLFYSLPASKTKGIPDEKTSKSYSDLEEVDETSSHLAAHSKAEESDPDADEFGLLFSSEPQDLPPSVVLSEKRKALGDKGIASSSSTVSSSLGGLPTADFESFDVEGKKASRSFFNGFGMFRKQKKEE